MGDFDDDDFRDYENEDLGFDEDELNDDEYDQLQQSLPRLQGLAKNYQVDDKTLKETLWNNYFSVDDAFEEVKHKPVSKLELLAQQRRQRTGLRGLGSGTGVGLLGRPAATRPRTQKQQTQPDRPSRVEVQEQPPAQPEQEQEQKPDPFAALLQPLVAASEFRILAPRSANPITSLFLAHVQLPSHTVPEINLYTNNDLAKKAASNFVKPSPDERKVQKLTEKVADIKLKDPKPVASKPKQKINVDAELAKKNSKPNLSFIVIGHVDSGKSTMIGRLLYDLGIVDSKTLHKLTKESDAIGKSSFSLAWIMDQTQEERARGVTVDICQTQIETDAAKFTIIDSPGHKDYVPQMINGVSQADLALMIIDANSFESGFSNQGQTKEHLTIAKNLGIERCVVAVNKMDVAQWSQTVYDSICTQIEQFLVEELEFERDNLIFLPSSGFLGDNVVSKSKNLPWYKGPTLMGVLEQENREMSHPVDKSSPFIMVISDIQDSSKTDELLVSGRVNSGVIQPGQSVSISPSQEVAVVDSISITTSNVGSSATKHNLQKIAQAGEFVELKLKKLASTENIKVGDVATLSSNVLQPVKKFKCEVRLFNIDRPLLVGTPFVLFKNGISVPSRLSEIESIINKDGKAKKRRHLSSNNRAVVVVELLERELPLVTYAQDHKLGRIVLRKDGLSIGAGKILQLVKFWPDRLARSLALTSWVLPILRFATVSSWCDDSTEMESFCRCNWRLISLITDEISSIDCSIWFTDSNCADFSSSKIDSFSCDSCWSCCWSRFEASSEYSGETVFSTASWSTEL
ncbi:hypothetical protein OGAPHI_000692 [Ogataea philodendri]|uniref:Elongation factor 1 alpha-like protein n=1 Tax=Ogataea philodendri TaxID=1378263 RepID=A0A9P8T9K9_9ASCO|nr:uncharacterized protein OGAPHI_000692 [Ogataea philodendri]KAH3670981.1 hypothetical protein OGAPHI_000692 [Ogataea philodendri]